MGVCWITFKLTETHVNMSSVTFLGHIVDATGRYPWVEKMNTITTLEYPKADVSAVRTRDWQPESWWFTAWSPAEKECSSTELECKALHDILLYYDVYLHSVRFDVFTDHNV